MAVDTCKVIEVFARSLEDLALELRYQMVEECTESKEDRIQWLKEEIDRAHGEAEYKEIAAAAALLFEIECSI